MSSIPTSFLKLLPLFSFLILITFFSQKKRKFTKFKCYFLAGNVRDLRSGVNPVKEEKEEVHIRRPPPSLSLLLLIGHTRTKEVGEGVVVKENFSSS